MIEILDHKRTPNIVGIVTAIAAIVVPIGIYILQSTGATGTKPDTATHWTNTDIFLVITIGVLVLSNGGHFMLSRVRRNKISGREVIRKLSVLQGSYILTPQYVTATQHGNHSKEGSLSEGGTADILTNSLKYDMIYSDAIATNIIRGATYIYILPNTSPIIQDLRNYITTIYESLHKELVAQNVTSYNRKSWMVGG